MSGKSRRVATPSFSTIVRLSFVCHPLSFAIQRWPLTRGEA
jgi:hypothetical protein